MIAILVPLADHLIEVAGTSVSAIGRDVYVRGRDQEPVKSRRVAPSACPELYS